MAKNKIKKAIEQNGVNSAVQGDGFFILLCVNRWKRVVFAFAGGGNFTLTTGEEAEWNLPSTQQNISFVELGGGGNGK